MLVYISLLEKVTMWTKSNIKHHACAIQSKAKGEKIFRAHADIYKLELLNKVLDKMTSEARFLVRIPAAHYVEEETHKL